MLQNASTLSCEGFVNLKDIDATIIQSVRYATPENFTGQIVPFYEIKNIILTKKCALTLKAVQAQVKNLGYSLVVYDGYRPLGAVNFFYHDWRILPDDPIVHQKYYPTLTKEDLFNGYIGKKSTHSRGSTVYLTLIKNGHSVHECQIIKKKLTNGKIITYLDDGTLDMGTSFDTFHQASHHDTLLISEQQSQNRLILMGAMEKYGFKKYDNEWWHYSLIDEPFPETYFEFPVTII